MTMPNFQAAGTGHETSVAWPTHQAGDLGILHVEHGITGTVATPTGWTLIVTLGVSNHDQTLFYKFAASGAEGNAALTGASDHHWGVITTYRNVHQTQPFHQGPVVSMRDAANATVRITGFSTLVDDCFIVHSIGYDVDSAGPVATGESLPSLANVVERYDGGTITGNGGGIVVITGEKAAAGEMTMGSTGVTSSLQSIISFALAPIADQSVSGTVTIDGAAAPATDALVYFYDVTQPAANYLVESATLSGGTYNADLPYSDHVYIPVYHKDEEFEPPVEWIAAAGEKHTSATSSVYDITHFTSGGGGYSRARVVNAGGH